MRLKRLTGLSTIKAGRVEHAARRTRDVTYRVVTLCPRFVDQVNACFSTFAMTPSTPQRANRSAHSHSHSLSYSHLRSPSSPATPYTPLSLRSFASSNPSPALTTPASVRNFPAGLKHSHFASPQVAKSYTSSPNVSRDQSLADLARNWRSCASKNGIKVATCDAPQFDDDDGG